MKNTLFLNLLALLLCFFLAGCSVINPQNTNTLGNGTADTTPAGTDSYKKVYAQLLENHTDDCYGYTYLPKGGMLIMLYNPVNPYETDEMYLELLQIEITDGKVNGNGFMYLGYVKGKVPIFYDEDWQDRLSDESHETLTRYESGFQHFQQNDGTELVLIAVFPNRVTGVEYERSEFYQLKPYDTLGTVPMTVQAPEWNDGYPAWFFVVEEANVDDSYELHYDGFVLSGTDIHSNTWRIGKAEPMPGG